jgi:GcrA cell cycle regulator
MSGWTDERVDALRQHWAGGLSASEIVRKLGGDVTRSAVIGKAHRLGLPGRANPSTPKARPVQSTLLKAPPVKKVRGQNAGLNFGARKFGEAAKAPPIISDNGAVHEAPVQRAPLVVVSSLAWKPLPGSTPRPWTERGRGCHWPVDVAGAEIQHSCCEPKDEDQRYCPAHRAMATSASQPAATAKGRVNELIRANRRHAA